MLAASEAPADDEGDLPGVLREVDGGLARRVATPDDDYRLLGHEWRFGHGGRVEDTPAEKLVDSGDIESGVGDTGSGDDRRGSYARSVGESDAQPTALCCVKARRLAHEQEASPESPGLAVHGQREAHSADAGREAWIVPDERG